MAKKKRKPRKTSARKKAAQQKTKLRKERRASERRLHKAQRDLDTLMAERNRVDGEYSEALRTVQRVLGTGTHADVLDVLAYAKKETKGNPSDLIKDVEVELERRKKPAPAHLRKGSEDEFTDEKRERDLWRLERWTAHYGIPWDPDDPNAKWGGLKSDGEMPIIISDNLPGMQVQTADGKPTKWGDGNVGTNLNMLLSDDDEAKRQRVIELPIRLLVRDGAGRVFIDYLARLGVLENIEEKYLGGPFTAVGTPDNFVALKAKDSQAMVMLCTVNSFETYGEIPLDELVLDDLSDEASEFYLTLFDQKRDPTQLYGGRVGKTKHKQIIENFIAVRNAAIRHKFPARKEDGWLWPGDDTTAPPPETNRLWPFVRDAVIFEFPEAAYRTLYMSYRNYFDNRAEALAEKDATDDDVAELCARLTTDGAKTSPWPKHLPFESTYLAYGRGVPTEMLSDQEPIGYTKGKYDSLILAHLVLADGDVIAFLGVPPHGVSLQAVLPEQLIIAPIYLRRAGKWLREKSLDPYIIPMLIEYINDHKTFVEEGKRGLAYQTLIGRSSKRMGVKPPIPPPFYVVYLQDKVIKERARRRQKLARKIEWQHRWRTRGSWNIRFKRGPLPLDPKEEKKLRKRKYQVFTVTKPDGELAAELAKRGIPPKAPGEWMAVLKYWRNPHIKGPPDKPLIESVRRSTKDWKEAEQ